MKKKNKKLTIMWFILILIGGLIIGGIVGANYFSSTKYLVNGNNIGKICYDTLAERNNAVLTDPDSMPEFTKTVNDRLSWDECKTGTINKMCFITSYNPSQNLLKCECWDIR